VTEYNERHHPCIELVYTDELPFTQLTPNEDKEKKTKKNGKNRRQNSKKKEKSSRNVTTIRADVTPAIINPERLQVTETYIVPYICSCMNACILIYNVQYTCVIFLYIICVHY
jgi:hypothetical protein